MIYYSIFGSNYLSKILKYLFLAIKTFALVIKEKPNIIFVMNPPIFVCIPILAYCTFNKNRGYITDSHASAFSLKIWKLLFPLQRFFFKKAITNIVTNATHGNIIKKCGGDVTIIGDIPVIYDKIKRYDKLKKSFNITVVNSFSFTEPVELILEAAKRLTDINFFITGDLKSASSKVLNSRPENVIFTDFLPNEQYAWLIKNSDVIMTQCTLDNTMQRGAYEAMSFEKPIITSDWQILRKTFYKGTVFVEANVDSIFEGIILMRKQYQQFKNEIIELRKERIDIWKKNKNVILTKIKKKLVKH
jgi:glycosyltransferase involved in cell wall biosynthesis